MPTKGAKPGKSRNVDEMLGDFLPDAERLALRAACDADSVGPRSSDAARDARRLATLNPDALVADVYGAGGTVAIVEEEVRSLLDRPAAVFMPSGTMIQQIALRIHADRRNRRVVAFHPTCHLEIHEDQAYQRLHGLIGRPVGDAHSLITLSDLEGIHEPLAALLIELPQREIGGPLPSWKDLKAQVGWAPIRALQFTWTARACGSAFRSTVGRCPRSRTCSTRSTYRSTKASAGRPVACSSATRM